MRMVRPRVLKTEKGYQEALASAEALMDAAPGSPQEEELERLAPLITAHEEARFPFDRPDPIAAIRFRMDQTGLSISSE